MIRGRRGQQAEGAGYSGWYLGWEMAEKVVLHCGGGEVKRERDGAGLVWISTRKA